MVGPQKPGDLDKQNLKWLRFVDPEDPTNIIQLALTDTGAVTADGVPIYALTVDPSEVGSKTVTQVIGVSISPGGQATGTIELKSNKGVAITVKADFNASATAGILAWLEASPDGVNWDSLTDKYVEDLEPVFAAGQTRQMTTIVDSAPKFIRAVVDNLDATYGVPVAVDFAEVG